MLRPLAMAAVVILLGASALHGQVREVSEELDYAAFAASVAPRLAEIEKEFSATFSSLEGLLNKTETQVLAILAPKELAPLRDSIRLRFRRIRQRLAPLRQARSPGFASFQTLADLEDLRASLFAEAQAVLERLVMLAKESRFSLRLCVVSRPDAGATFRMRPPEYREGVQSGRTVLDIRNAALGRYFYKVEPRKKKIQPIECGWNSGGEDDQCLDLWDSSGDQLFECNFAEDERGCELHDLPPGGCSAP